MKHVFRLTLGLLVLCGLAVLSGAAEAQTTANGPYYATPSWDQKLQCDMQATCPRFIVLSNWNSDAVLDRETGLVWEKSPATNSRRWVDARFDCANKRVGGRMGWRLPSMNELASLIDPSLGFPAPGLALPAGHPFTNVQELPYWSATTDAAVDVDPNGAWSVFLNGGGVGPFLKGVPLPVWCVRGGGLLDNY